MRMLVDRLAGGLTRGAPLVLGRLTVVIDNVRSPRAYTGRDFKLSGVAPVACVASTELSTIRP